MSRIGNRVLLGYEDESITEKYKSQVDYTTNKIGGRPNWPGDAPTAVTCKLCGLNIPLVLQIYAPLENSQYHRTLYIFACINPNCWNQTGSWVCLRSQILELNSDIKQQGGNGADITENNTEWCSGGDTWCDDDEENGNVIASMVVGSGGGITAPGASSAEINRLLTSMSIVDKNNANGGGGGAGACAGGGACALGVVQAATAVIEGDEGEVVSIDTPTLPQVNIVSLLEEAAPLPQVPISDLEFVPSFISVGEEDMGSTISPTSLDHVRDLLKEYQMKTGGSGMCDEDLTPVVGSSSSGGSEAENYEKSLPAHGDKLFHQFLSRIQANPGQLLRYGGRPLFLYPVQQKELPRICSYCGGELVFEIQVLPTLIPKLRLSGSERSGHLEYGAVFLYTCQASCWHPSDSFREEPLVVQAEKIL